MIRIGLVGDYSSSVVAHRAIPLALDLVAKKHSWNVQAEWLPTKALEQNAKQRLSNFTAIWVVPGSPYESERGALAPLRPPSLCFEKRKHPASLRRPLPKRC